MLYFHFIIYLDMSLENCLFCKIIAGEISSEFVYEDDFCVAFSDINPQSPTHLLIVPREHIASLDKARNKHQETLGCLLLVAAEIAREKEFAENGYRTVINTNGDGGQTVFHLHVHLLAGRPFIFPPG